MSELASRSQLRMSFVRWALVTVPATVFLGFLSGRLARADAGNPWFDALVKPDLMPPGWAFGLIWTVLYIMLGLALAIVLNARGARMRGTAISLYIVQLVLNLAWSPLFFGAHKVTAALGLIAAMLVAALATTLVFGRVRASAAWLMVPYLIWLCIAATLNYRIMQLNPSADALVPRAPATHIEL